MSALQQTMVCTIEKMYLERLNANMAARLKAIQNAKMIDPCDLTEEVGLMRLTVEDSLEMYQAISEAVDTAVEAQAAAATTTTSPDFAKQQNAVKTSAIQARIAAGDVMAKSIKNVADIADRAARTRQAGQDLLDARTLRQTLQNVAVLATECFSSAEELEQFIGRLKAFELPKDGSEGTTLRPDDDVRMMDAMTNPLPTQE